jgi:uncharacterized DUF497 family protein
MKNKRFKWDADKDAENQEKHGMPFSLAQYAFADPCRVIAEDLAHSELKNAIFVSAMSRRHTHRPLYISRRCNSHIWRWLLAKGKINL